MNIKKVEDLYKTIIRIEDETGEGFIDLGLFPSYSFEEDTFIEWIKTNKPLSYKRTMKALAENKMQIDALESNDLVEAFCSTIMLRLPEDKEIDTSSEYPLSSGNEYENWYRIIELLAEFCFSDEECLGEMISYKISQFI